MEPLIKELYEQYEQTSKKYLDKKWFNKRGFYKRVTGNTAHYAHLIGKEHQISQDSLLFARDTLKKHEALEKESIGEVVVAMKNHRERLVSRATYLTLLAASFGLVTAVTGLSLSLGVSSGLWPSFVTLMLFVPLFLLLLERDRLNVHATITIELVNILELIKNHLDKK
ncbi:hypothetical protein AB6D81_02345 [Vibrio splendidus]|uniref:hypothetical protein n=1 Tax=Vibrio splendidus TaxID=29497 RepID=UPI000C861FAF|nr:hypothetical protein [Vibrio splendidus]PMG56615.1 hypothetical protein BCU89_10645 [Vibrio splendidus]